MKFDLHQYWKHKNCLDVFFSVRDCRFDDDGRNAILQGTWCTQTIGRWFFTVPARLFIKPDQYQNWEPYTPRGTPKL